MRPLRTPHVILLSVVVSCGDQTAPNDPGDAGTDADGRIDLAFDGGNEADSPFSSTALLCDGIDDRLLIAVPGLLSDPDALTVELWFRIDRPLPVGSPREYLLSASSGDAFHDELSIGLSDSYGRQHRGIGFSARVQDDGTCDDARGSNWLDELEPGRWYHFAATLDRSAEGAVIQRVFIDGVAKAGNFSPWPADEDMCIDAAVITVCAGIEFNGLFSAPFVGAIDDIRISDSVRYVDDFTPETPTLDESTLILLTFDDGTIEARGAEGLELTVEGAPELIGRTD